MGIRYYDITSLFSNPREANIILHGFFVLPASHMINSTPPIEQPAPGMGSFATISPNETSHFEESSCVRAGFPNEVSFTGIDFNLPVTASTLDANFEIDLESLSQIAAGPVDITPRRQDGLHDTPFTNPFANDLPQQNLSDIFRDEIPSQEYDFSRSLETNPNILSATPETSFSSSHYDQVTPHDIFSLNIPSQDSLETNPYQPPPSKEYDSSRNLETSPNVLSATPQTSFSSNDFNQDKVSEIFVSESPDIQATHLIGPSTMQETRNDSDLTSIPIPDTPSPSSPASNNNSSPDRHSCSQCSATFKRTGDVKRHEKVHIPGQRRFHCWQLGCERNGRRGFYRRDKLRDHEKQVHGL